jgi:hypothetical protein
MIQGRQGACQSLDMRRLAMCQQCKDDLQSTPSPARHIRPEFSGPARYALACAPKLLDVLTASSKRSEQCLIPQCPRFVSRADTTTKPVPSS